MILMDRNGITIVGTTKNPCKAAKDAATSDGVVSRLRSPKHYANGAAFERRVKEHLDKELQNQTKGTSIKYYIVRSAGSKGKLDLVVLLTDTSTGYQRIIGIQAKLTRPSYKGMDTFIAQVKYETGIDVYYVFRSNRDIEFYPSIPTKWGVFC